MPYSRWYEGADEDCEWVLLSGWLKLRCWHGVAVRYTNPVCGRAYVPLTDEVRAILERLAAEVRLLPKCLVGAP
jgi:hypothetical protein